MTKKPTLSKDYTKKQKKIAKLLEQSIINELTKRPR
jgi:hypothetical protein